MGRNDKFDGPCRTDRIIALGLEWGKDRNEKWREHFENLRSSKQSTTLIMRLDCKLCRKSDARMDPARKQQLDDNLLYWVHRQRQKMRWTQRENNSWTTCWGWYGNMWQHKLRSGGQTAAACGASKELKSMRKPWQFTFSLWSQSSSSAGSQDNSHQGANLQVNDPVAQSSVERDEELRHYVQGHTLGGFDL
jgi:hypothetical protein